MRRILAIALCLCLLAGCSAAPETADDEHSSGDIISDAVTKEEPGGVSSFGLAYQEEFALNPYKCTSLTNRTILSLLYESLFTVTSGFEVEPVLCDYYDISENLQNYTVHLLSGVRFSDGAPLTAADVKASYQAAINSDVYGSRFYALDSVEVMDDSTVVFHTTQPYENLPILLDVPIVKADTAADNAPIGTGAYRLVTDRYTSTLVRSGVWWRGQHDAAVSVQSIRLVPTDTPTAVRDDFEYGITGVVCTDPNSAAYVDYHCDYELWNCSTTIMDYVGFNVHHGLFSLPELRIAFTNIIDRDTIATELYRGYAEAAVLPASPLSSCYDTKLAERYDYEPTKFSAAVALTKAKGSSATFLVCSADPRRVEAAEFIAAEALKYGIELVVDAVNDSTYRNRLYSGDFDLYLGEVRLSATYDLSSFFNDGALCYGYINSTDLTAKCKEALKNSGAYYDLHEAVLSAGMLCPVLFKSYAVYATRGTITNMYPAVDNVFHTSNGRTLSDALPVLPTHEAPDEETAPDGENPDAQTPDGETTDGETTDGEATDETNSDEQPPDGR